MIKNRTHKSFSTWIDTPLVGGGVSLKMSYKLKFGVQIESILLRNQLSRLRIELTKVSPLGSMHFTVSGLVLKWALIKDLVKLNPSYLFERKHPLKFLIDSRANFLVSQQN